MTNICNTWKTSVVEFCTAIGMDPLLVQGAGGNVSWKDGEVLWIKASGTSLAEAADRDIFVPVDLPHLSTALESNNFSVTPRSRSNSVLRPSIETLLHALMPHRVVIHLHAIEILAHLVRDGWETHFRSLTLEKSIQWIAVDYKKPGAELAEAVKLALLTTDRANVVFLQSHGVVIGGEDTREVADILKSLIESFRINQRPHEVTQSPTTPLSIAGHSTYYPVSDQAVHQLATDINLFSRLKSDWALYPDHVVFLGSHPHTYVNMDTLLIESRVTNELPELIFVQGIGVFTSAGLSKAKQAQLRCYYDVIVRQKNHLCLNTLTSCQISELLNWDAEQYRTQLSKS